MTSGIATVKARELSPEVRRRLGKVGDEAIVEMRVAQVGSGTGDIRAASTAAASDATIVDAKLTAVRAFFRDPIPLNIDPTQLLHEGRQEFARSGTG